MYEATFAPSPRPAAIRAGLFGLLPPQHAGITTCAALLLAYAALVAARLPHVWLNGRFRAEEGAVYFRITASEMQVSKSRPDERLSDPDAPCPPFPIGCN
jgi:hypothetical protein